MSTSSVQATTALQNLATAVLGHFDKNGDGQLGGSEFADFLGTLVGTTASSTVTAALSATTTTPLIVSTSTTGSAYDGAPTSAMEGFDFAKVRNQSHDTVKYKFARVAWNRDLSSVKDKASAETLLRSMLTDFAAAGLNVLEVKGDSIKVKDGANEFWVDVVRGANSGSPAFQWLVAS